MVKIGNFPNQSLLRHRAEKQVAYSIDLIHTFPVVYFKVLILHPI